MSIFHTQRSWRELVPLGRVERALASFLLVLSSGMAAPASAQDPGVPSQESAPPTQDQAASTQEPTASSQDQKESAARSIRCPTPANPRNFHFECLGKEFDAIEETLTKDWAGFRTELTKLGITPIVSYTAQFMDNPSGGHNQGFTYAGTLQAAIAWDLHKLIGIPGLSFNVGASWSSGENLSSKYIGNVFTVQSAFTGSGLVNLDQMYLREQLFDSALTFAVGRLAPANTFATLPVFSNYLNDGINTGIGSLGINDPTFTSSPPGVEWGAQAIYNVTPFLHMAVGVFNTNPNAAAGNDHGVNFAFQQGNTGVLTVGQVNYLVNQAPGETGLPGQYTIGGFYDSNDFRSLSNPSNMVAGNYSVYALFQQMVYRDGEGSSQKGLTVWGEVAFSPKPSVNTMPYFVGAGMSYQGLIPGRGQDIASLGVIYGTFSGYIPSTSAETVIEANYQVTLASWLSVTPDVQYVIKPTGSSGIPNAFVIGAQLAVTF
jgi:porin